MFFVKFLGNMPVELNIFTPNKNFNKSANSISVKDYSFGDAAAGEELTTVFRDLHVSAYSKAASISPAVTSITLGANTSNKETQETVSDIKEDYENSLPSAALYTSTPEKNKSGNSLSQKEIKKIKEKIENLSPVLIRNKMFADGGISYKKLLNEFDAQRRLTVDKVMRERIQNMYDTGKLIRDSLEHLKQARLEEAIARRLLLERKILDDIRQQEILNKPKREAEWAQDNLKEAQRIQERNQRVKEAAEEARKKSECISNYQIQIFNLHKEYNQEYVTMLESIKSCKDKTALSDFTATQSKTLKECNETFEKLLKRCKQADVNEECVESAKNLVETIKTLHEGFRKEINRIHEEIKAKKEESAKVSEAVPSSPPSSSSAPPPPSPGSESGQQRRFFAQNDGPKSFEEINSGSSPPETLKRKSSRSISQSTKKKSTKICESNIVTDRATKVSKMKLSTNSVGVLKTVKKALLANSNTFEKGDVHKHRSKTLGTRKKKLKKVRFSDSTEIIGTKFYEAKKSEHPLTGPPHACYKDTPIKNLSDCFDTKSLETYIGLKKVLENCLKNIEPLLTDDSMKKFKFNCQKAVNIPVNAISPVSGPHLSDKYLKLHNLLSGRSVDIGDVKISATQHPQGIAYCKYLLAKKFVRQGDLTVSSKPDAAFSIAAVLASLWVDFPDFGELVLAHFYSACPYLAPVFLPQVEGQSNEEYHKSLGYHYSQNGEVEKQDSFLKRMSGIMRLYSALLIATVRQPGRMNPLGLAEGWRWLSALLNLEPRPDICPTLLYDFLEVAGNEMFRAYGGQFKKMLAYTCQEYYPKLEKVTPSSALGPMVRLEGFLQKVLNEESIPCPMGTLPSNFW